jgi:hypothetical protein
MRINAFTVDLDPRNRLEVVQGIALSTLGEISGSYVRIGDAAAKPKARGKQLSRDQVELLPVRNAEGTRLMFCTPVLVSNELALTTHELRIQPEKRAIVRLRIPGGSLGGCTDWRVREPNGSRPKPEFALTQHQWREQRKIPAGGKKLVVELAWGDVVSKRETYIEYLFALPRDLMLVINRSGNVSPEVYRTVTVQWDGKDLNAKFMALAVAATKRRETEATV